MFCGHSLNSLALYAPLEIFYFFRLTYFFTLNLSEIVWEQVRFAVPVVAACLCHCQYDAICREFQSADST